MARRELGEQPGVLVGVVAAECRAEAGAVRQQVAAGAGAPGVAQRRPEALVRAPQLAVPGDEAVLFQRRISPPSP
jgi:hypothetical protein